MLPIIVLNAAVCLIASTRFHRRFRPNSSFTWNTLLGSLTFLAMWTPLSICILLEYGDRWLTVLNVVYLVIVI